MDALCFFLIQRYLRLSVSCIALLLFIAYEQQTAEDKAYYRSRQHDNVIHRTVFDDHYSGEDHAQRAACGERTKAAIQSSFRQIRSLISSTIPIRMRTEGMIAQ